jgi:hypothetical protein
MKQIMLGLVIGLGLGTAISLHAQTTRTAPPCAPRWILWQQSVQPYGLAKSWPREGYSNDLECLTEKRSMNQSEFEHPDSTLATVYSCFPETFDPRPKPVTP